MTPRRDHYQFPRGSFYYLCKGHIYAGCTNSRAGPPSVLAPFLKRVLIVLLGDAARFVQPVQLAREAPFQLVAFGAQRGDLAVDRADRLVLGLAGALELRFGFVQLRSRWAGFGLARFSRGLAPGLARLEPVRSLPSASICSLDDPRDTRMTWPGLARAAADSLGSSTSCAAPIANKSVSAPHARNAAARLGAAT